MLARFGFFGFPSPWLSWARPAGNSSWPSGGIAPWSLPRANGLKLPCRPYLGVCDGSFSKTNWGDTRYKPKKPRTSLEGKPKKPRVPLGPGREAFKKNIEPPWKGSQRSHDELAAGREAKEAKSSQGERKPKKPRAVKEKGATEV